MDRSKVPDMSPVIARPAMILALPRTGGTFLGYCLSNHPDIFCFRGEPLHWQDAGRKYCTDTPAVFRLVWEQKHYEVSMLRVVDGDMFQGGRWKCLLKLRFRPKVIYLKRENVLHHAVSVELNKAHRFRRLKGHPSHSLNRLEPQMVALDPDELLATCDDLVGRNKRCKILLKGTDFKVLWLTYEDLVGPEGSEAECILESAAFQICDFLGVKELPLCSRLRKIHYRPLAETLSNWNVIEAKVRRSSYSGFLHRS
jgi:LPS sulfotransferase NodH